MKLEAFQPQSASDPIVPGCSVRIGDLLAEDGRLGGDQVDRVLQMQRAHGLRFGEAALRLGLISRDDLNRAIARQFDLPRPPAGAERASRELVIAYDLSHPAAEDVRALRTQLLIRWSRAGEGRRALAIASAVAGEGRSYVAANLAVAFAQLGERTLLVDADLRAPRQHRIFGVADSAGLSAVLSGRAGGEAVLAMPDFGPLSLLPAGARPPNPQELLSRPAFAALLRDLKNGFDRVLLDTPPAKLYADAHGIAYCAGSAIVLARKDHTHLADVANLVNELGDAGATVMGSVFNVF